MNLARSSFKILLAKVTAAITSFVAVVVFSRELGASPLGSYYPFIALLGFLSIPADIGIRSAAEKRISEGEDLSLYLGTAIALKAPFLIAVLIAILLLSPYIEQYLGRDLAVPLAIAIVVQEMARFSIYVLRGELRVGETAVVQTLRPIGWLLVGYLLLSSGYGVEGLVYGYIVGTMAMMIIGWWKVATKPTWPTFRHARSLLRYSKFSALSSVGAYFYGWMDVAILTLFLTLGITGTRAEIGAYENAWKVSTLVMLVGQAIALSIFPQFSRWNAEDATDRIEAIIPSALIGSILFVIPTFAGTIVLSKDILMVLFGAEFTVAWLALIILAGEKIFQSVLIISGKVLMALDRPDLDAYATLLAILVNLVLNVILIWKFGIVGAALATTISFATNTIVQTYYMNRILNVKLPVNEILWCVVASVVMGIVVYLARSTFEINSMVRLIAVILLGAIFYAAFVLTYEPIQGRVQGILNSISSENTTWIH